MFKIAVLAAVFAGAVSSTALAWSETTISLTDPNSFQAEGTLETGMMEGYFCSNRPDADTIAHYLSGVKVHAEDLAMALRNCNPDVRPVAGIFPAKGNYPVAFVKMLDDVNRSSYLVRGLLSNMRLQEARAQ